MALFRISGIWTDSNKLITHYGFHTVDVEKNTATRLEKISKAEAILLLGIKENRATTWIWDYNVSAWIVGEEVELVTTSEGSYLRSNAERNETNNLAHLIDYDWIRR